MLRPFLLLVLAASLAGCSSQNASLSTLQFAGETVPYPDHYEAEAARLVEERGVEPALVTVSQPQTTLGAGPFSPRRWYICVRGMPTSAKPRPARPVEVLEEWLGQRTTAGVHDVVLIFSGTAGRPSVRSGYDSPLCRGLQYGPITAEAPLI